MSLRQQSLELAILARLLQGPSHGYELRKHVNTVLGFLHSVSYGSLYPALRRLASRGLICDCAAGPTRIVGSRARRMYHLTAAGQNELAAELGKVAPDAWTDDHFGVRFSLFGITDPQARLTILHGRRSYARERLVNLKAALASSQPDGYTQELVRYAHDSVVRELEWLDGVIAIEETSVGGAVSSGSYPTKENRR